MTQKVEVVRTEHLIAHDTVVECIGEMAFDEWKELGWKLKFAERCCQWYLGWWWNNGHKKWSREAEAFIEELGYKRETLKVYGSVCNAVKPLMRINDLSFNHHQLVAPCKPAEQQDWLQQAKDNDWSVSVLRKAMRDALPKPPLPKGTYRVIYADPPWEYGDKLIKGYGAAEHHYPPMSIEELAQLPVKDLAAPDSVLFLWVTSPLLLEIEPIVDGWGFEYRTSFVWDKVKHNYGHYNSVRHELLLVCTRGSCVPETKKLFDSVVTVERTDKHSEKPNEFRRIIETLYPTGPWLELFARKASNGWEVWGNEV